jgi:hypothetical protein
MTLSEANKCLHVIYRASRSNGRPVEMHLAIRPEAATVADAWAKLTAFDSLLDPRSLEIEIYQPRGHRWLPPHTPGSGKSWAGSPKALADRVAEIV